MINIKIQNYRGIKNADFDCSPITAFFGPNGAGKSSIAGAIRALLSGEPLASSGLTKKDAYMLINRTANGEDAYATADVDDVHIETKWPECTTTTDGKLKCSSIGIGLKDPLSISQKDKDRFFCEMLNANPSRGDLYDEVKHIVDHDTFENKIWADVLANGWDTMSSHYSDQAKTKKGAWKQITGENWGSAKATNWLPSNWSPKLETASRVQLQTAIAGAQEELENIAASNAIDDHKLAQLIRLSESEDQLHNDLQTWRDQLEKNKSDIDKARKKMIDIELQIENLSSDIDHVAHCPSCNVCLKLVDGKLEHSIELSPEEVRENRTKYDTLQAQHEKGKTYLSEKENQTQMVSKKIDSITKEIDAAQEATKAVAEHKKTANQGLINKAREDLRIANENLSAWEKQKQAQKAAKAVDYYLEMSNVLSSSGLRKKVLISKIEELNEQIYKNFPWPVKIDDNLNFKFDNRPASICCESERWRISVVIQSLIAIVQDDPIVIIDRADVLDNKQKNLFFKTLLSMPFTSIVMLKADNPKDVLDLEKRGVGRSFWVEEGTVQAV